VEAGAGIAGTICAVPDLLPAWFVMSIDVEMSWGAVHHGAPHDDRPYRHDREVVDDLLSLLDRYGIAATWAVVGHLFLDRCSKLDGRLHPEIIRPGYEWLPGDWYDLDPGSDVDTDPTWYGPELVDRIRSSATPQEIGSHSFGHIIVGDGGCSADAFRSDLEAARTVAAAVGVESRSFVYPRNSVGHLDVLEEAGFHAFRGPTPPRFAALPSVLRRLAAGADRVRPLASGSVSPIRRGGLVDIPQTYLFDPASTRARRLGTGAWGRLVRRRLRHAVRIGSLFHLWFHSHNLAADPERALGAMEIVLDEARRLVDAGDLVNLTMGEAADRWRAEEARR